MKRYLLYALLLLLPQITHATPIDGQTLWALSARICAEANESLSKLCVIDSTLDNLDLNFDFGDEISIIEEVICSKIDELDDCIPITQEDIDAGFTISSPGKYCLVENVTYQNTSTTSAAIKISADNVTLDLGGHTIDGINTGFRGIVTSDTRENITIQNGTITSCTNTGILITNTTRLCIANITSIDNTTGIFINTCTNILIKNCITKNNTNSGIGIQNVVNATIKNCISQNNNDGFFINLCDNSIILNCKATNNNNSGFRIVTSNNTTICRCLSLNNNRFGFYMQTSNNNTSLINNKAIGNLFRGFLNALSPTTSAFANLAHSNGTNYSGITNSIETTVDTTTSYWTNVSQ